MLINCLNSRQKHFGVRHNNKFIYKEGPVKMSGMLLHYLPEIELLPNVTIHIDLELSSSGEALMATDDEEDCR